MKVLLVYPGLVEGFDSYNDGRDWFNHGIGIISSLLKDKGHDVTYLDCRKLTGWEAVESEIRKTDFELAMISVATVDFKAARRIAALVKAKDAGLKVMVGGPHPTLMTGETAAVAEFDHVFTHEAENTLPKMLEAFPDIPRIIRGEMPMNLDLLPFVDRSLAPAGETPWFSGLERPYFSITASRGCVYKCTFCQPAERAVFGDKVRKRSVDNILDELQILSRDYGMRSFMIHDDCFTQYSEWVEEFCRKKLERGFTQPFACQSRADMICRRPDLLKQLKEAGLSWVLIGFESGSDRVLKFIKKGTTVSQNIEAAGVCKQLGIRIFANYMFGIPTETDEEIRQTVSMMRKIRPDMHSPSIFTPAPGSELYDYCHEHGLMLPDDEMNYSREIKSGAKIRNVNYPLIRRAVYESRHGKLFGRLRQILVGVKGLVFR
ncbi:MAG: hypothetical protein A2X82_17975 [Geobacteraceae bacterium GWC2_55_20]|nr:MAG: hypothetical protein A2X82_17975 [Geobacteraceae bacterium GWC2_55_20]OGU25190.1 MAG: hypothetical protein A2X85_11945 [Geobacteraceae bacterium GWF2_54_21]HCE67768.1 hypothetical protein [Geobacter sp.]